MNRKVVLYAKYGYEYDSEELDSIREEFYLTPHRTDIKPGDLVVGRYSMLPFYQGQEEDILNAGATVINSYRAHRYIADLANWYNELQGLTPKTWFWLKDIDEPGPYVLKGETNSKRQKWSTHMYAADLRAAGEVYNRLQEDSFIGSQSIYIRKYIELSKLGEQVTGMPISEEYRFFICDGQILSGAFYWSSCIEDIAEIPDYRNAPKDFIQEAVSRIGNRARYYAMDVARTATGSWIVVELNDGQMSGLSENSPGVIYSNLARVLDGKDSLFTW